MATLAIVVSWASTAGATDFTATSLSGGTWQNSANWNVTPSGSQNGYPNNVGADVFDVSIPSSVSFDLSGNVTVRDLTIVCNGASMSGNNFAFNGGEVFGSGSAFSVSSFALNGATLEIGATADTADSLTIAGNVSNPVNSVVAVDLGGLGQGTTYDHLIFPNGTGLGGATLDISLFGGFTPTPTDTFTIMTGNNFNGQFANDLSGTIFAPGFGTFSVSYAPTSVVLGNFVPVPEPSLVASAAFTLVCLVAMRRCGTRGNQASNAATRSQQ